MKKLLAIILAVVMVLSLAACGGGSAEPTKKPVTYPKHMGKLDEFPGGVSYEFYDWNEVAEGKVYGIEYVPAGFNKESGEKCFDNSFVFKQFHIPLQCKASPYCTAF